MSWRLLAVRTIERSRKKMGGGQVDTQTAAAAVVVVVGASFAGQRVANELRKHPSEFEVYLVDQKSYWVSRRRRGYISDREFPPQ